jgi:transketolase
MKSFGNYNSNLGGHPDLRKVPYVEASTGSLGHGLPIALGLAKGAKILGKANKIFTIVGDGECNEGTIWESALLASEHKLDNLCCIVDHNHSTDRALNVGNLFEKFKSFGWHAKIVNGHNDEELIETFQKFPLSNGKPFVVIAETIKGFGAKSIENQPSWHHKIPNLEELELIIKEIYEHE